MFSSAAAAAGINYFGQRDANETNREIARDTNRFSAKEAQRNREFQERMSNTSWQRGVADMKAAGINPMLAFSQGGASSPGGASAIGTTGSPQQSNTGGAVSSALDVMRLRADLDNLREMNNQIKSQTSLNKSNADLARANSRSVLADLPRVQTTSSAFQSLTDFGKNLKKYGKSFGFDFTNNLVDFKHRNDLSNYTTAYQKAKAERAQRFEYNSRLREAYRQRYSK